MSCVNSGKVKHGVEENVAAGLLAFVILIFSSQNEPYMWNCGWYHLNLEWKWYWRDDQLKIDLGTSMWNQKQRQVIIFL